MRLLGIDYGTKRIGLALSDPLGITVQPLLVISRKSLKDDIEKIKDIVLNKEVDKIILGLPMNMNDTPGILCKEIKDFANRLSQEIKIAVEFCDERLTSHEADNILINEAKLSNDKRKQIKDKIAACIILQTYLDRRNQKQK
ncbi:MAG: Holliday junction resolvase RuvX [Elusimicrobia bacterium]|nr:Holliday junction resolvase RuvX [Candidatus Liberimonas magnetica]